MKIKQTNRSTDDRCVNGNKQLVEDTAEDDDFMIYVAHYVHCLNNNGEVIYDREKAARHHPCLQITCRFRNYNNTTE